MIIYVGTYTRREPHAPKGHGDGLYVFDFDENNGTLKKLHKNAFDAGVNPSFLAISKNKKWLYAGTEDGNAKEGCIYGFEIQPDHSLKKIGTWGVKGVGTAHLVVHNDDMLLTATNYASGSIITYNIDQATGELSEISFFQHEVFTNKWPERQAGPHVHMCLSDDAHSNMYGTDLGGDRIYKYKIELDGLVKHTDANWWAMTPLGSGPRHIALHPTGSHMYVSFELSNEVGVYRICPSGIYCFSRALELVQICPTLPEGFKEWNHVADIHVTPNGRFLYVSNRGHDSLVQFNIDPETHLITFFGQHYSSKGHIPRNFMITPCGKWLLCANQDTDNIVVFSIAEDGTLVVQSESECATPVCLMPLL